MYTNNPDKYEDWQQMVHTDILNFTRGDKSKVCVCVCVCVFVCVCVLVHVWS